MEREEILKRAQSKKEDEYITKVEADGRMYGMNALDTICLFVLLYVWFFDMNSYAMIAGRKVAMETLLLFTYFVPEFIYNGYLYIKLKRKWRLIWSITLLIALSFAILEIFFGIESFAQLFIVGMLL